MNVYFISGLGADERVFKYIKLHPQYTMIHIQWIKPLKKESLADYAKRMPSIIDTTVPFVLVGLSMGGMLATEIAKLTKPEKVILISSIPISSNLPTTYRRFHRMKLTSLVPVSVFKNASILKKIFGRYTKEHRDLLINVIRDSEAAFIKWAIPAVAGWQNETLPDNLYHIHGSADNVLPMKFTTPTHVIEKGRHFMVVERANEIAEIINEIIG